MGTALERLRSAQADRARSNQMGLQLRCNPGGYCGLLEEGRPGAGTCWGGNLDIVIRLWSSILLEEFDIVAMDAIC